MAFMVVVCVCNDREECDCRFGVGASQIKICLSSLVFNVLVVTRHQLPTRWRWRVGVEGPVTLGLRLVGRGDPLDWA